ncbi:uncharacterized protein LOC131336518 isoform X2 [Rhododendron vialii]|uniref:uncharacterized protein LOC131336518 isoform X2 n=1 Tax=Rhododendron vialii TaxID=182163 RepID=UPI00265F657C|nr:uncharacterized protein LOC131336518 isoform X2 [Rhododendron vialii]
MLNQYCKNLHVINNSLEDGWGEFYDDNHLQQEFKIIFGYQHKWIFEVFMLDENLNRDKYGPMNANSDLVDNNAPSGEIMTAWLPSIFFADRYPLQFAYVKAPQTSVSQGSLQPIGLEILQIMLNLQDSNLMLVAVLRHPDDVRLLVLYSNGFEKMYSWFE